MQIYAVYIGLLILMRATCRESACLLVLCRNSDASEIKKTLEAFEARFNREYAYPYVFLNNEEFSEEFKGIIRSVTTAPLEFGVVPKAHWGYPPWVDQQKAKESMRKMEKEGVIYGGVESYRHMCRFFSGFFYQHQLMEKYQYYWRIEPGTTLHCNIKYDPFTYMKDNKKKYGFVITLYEFPATIPSLWKGVTNFISEYNTKYTEGKFWKLISDKNLLRFVTDEALTKYNLCHFWSNFEIADFSFFRNQKYQLFFDYLDRTGGFFYERWGDAPVHSIAASLFLSPNEIHYFEDIGYTHPPFTHCPNASIRNDCDCDPVRSVSISIPSCTALYKKVKIFS
ncbi:alpha 1,2-mannosyltransferase [Nematocida sp. LUAm3]|nr:alpha 1,2-mannosyltransferase [Nematocida sp. LUAm3]KAI5173870.1 alpha 1,2-mannosyltransferase [Nematocida sp. LUAm2]KAI5177385.1 alpha 1,2-mannosyltransferase [Nematocida sp. LUAm1]